MQCQLDLHIGFNKSLLWTSINVEDCKLTWTYCKYLSSQRVIELTMSSDTKILHIYNNPFLLFDLF